MTTTLLQRIWTPVDFTSLISQVNLPVLRLAVEAAMPLEPPTTFELIGINTVMARWNDGVPGSVELAAADVAVAAHTGFTTTDAAVQFENLGNVDTDGATGSSPLVEVFNELSAPLVAGTYLVLSVSKIWMPSTVANTFITAEFRLGFGAGVGVLICQDTFNSAPETHAGSFVGHGMIAVEAGAQLRMVQRIGKLGATAATARASNSRMSYCRVA